MIWSAAVLFTAKGRRFYGQVFYHYNCEGER
jgi:hypothetical protein